MANNQLEETLDTIRGRIDLHHGKGISEEGTKTALINPLLRDLGWDTENLHEVSPEYSSPGGRVDYALLIENKPRLLIEAKSLDTNLDNLKWATQLTAYAVATGVRWALLTNGDEYRIFNAYAEVPIDEKVFRTVQLCSQDSHASETLSLLSRSATLENRLDMHWETELEKRRRQHLGQQVRTTLRGLFEQAPPNERFLRLLRDQPGCNLALGEIREGLNQVRVQFEIDMADPPRVDPPKPPMPIAPAKGVRVLLKDLVDAGIIEAPLAIHRNYKQQLHKARIETDGTISFQDKSYWSPSGAGKAVRILHGATPNAAQTAGWAFWKFTDTDGKVKPISELRRRYLSHHNP